MNVPKTSASRPARTQRSSSTWARSGSRNGSTASSRRASDGSRWRLRVPRTSIALVAEDMSEGIEISFATDDAEADHASMLEAGVEADPALIRMGEGVPPMFTFRDPDGNRFRMVERD